MLHLISSRISLGTTVETRPVATSIINIWKGQTVPLNTIDDPVSTDRPRHFCVCDGPEWGDARFISNWLSAVLTADTQINAYLVAHPRFRSRVARIEIENIIELRPVAMFLLAAWLKAEDAEYSWEMVFHIDIERDWCSELFVIMVKLGLLELQRDHYRMSIPKQFNMNVLRKALLELAKTEDCESNLHPERLLHSMSSQNAEICKAAIRQTKLAGCQAAMRCTKNRQFAEF
jgi:hypothetical protein